MNVTSEQLIPVEALSSQIKLEVVALHAEYATAPSDELVEQLFAFVDNEDQDRSRTNRKMLRELFLWVGPYFAFMVVGVAIYTWLIHKYGLPDDTNWRIIIGQFPMIIMLGGFTLAMGIALGRTLWWKDPAPAERVRRFGSAAGPVYRCWQEWEFLLEELVIELDHEDPLVLHWHLAKVRYARLLAPKVASLMERANQCHKNNGLVDDEALGTECASMAQQVQSVRNR